jgi:hypothetical protein
LTVTGKRTSSRGSRSNISIDLKLINKTEGKNMKCKQTYFLLFFMLLYAAKIEASLSAHPGSIEDTLYSGGSNTSILHITNIGPASQLGYQVSSESEWITFSSVSGSIGVGDTVSIVITYNLNMLLPGLNSGEILIGDPHHGPISIPVNIVFLNPTGIDEDSKLPGSFVLEQNYPNPFNPETKISFSVPFKQKISLKIYNLLGNEIISLIDEEKAKGSYSYNVDMSRFPSGVYFYKIEAANFKQTKKMILNK